MKKGLVLFMSLILLFSLSACSIMEEIGKRIGEWGRYNTPHYDDGGDHGSYQDEETDEIMLNVIDALETKDKEKLQSLFIPKALEEAVYIDEGIEYVLEFYSGSMQNWTRLAGGDGMKTGQGERLDTSWVTYQIETEDGVYILRLTRLKIASPERTENGLYQMVLTSEEDADNWTHLSYGGLYIPFEVQSELIGEILINALESNDFGKIKDIVSSNASSSLEEDFFEIAQLVRQGVYGWNVDHISSSSAQSIDNHTYSNGWSIRAYYNIDTSSESCTIRVEWYFVVYYNSLQPNSRLIGSIALVNS